MSDKDPIAYLSSEEAKQHLNQLDVETVQAFSKILQIPSIQPFEKADVIPPEDAKGFVEWLSTKAGKKYLGQLDPKFLKAYAELLAFGPPIIHKPIDQL